MSRLCSGLAMAIVAAWCLVSLATPWTCAYIPAAWPHKVMGAAALAGVSGLLLLARRRPGTALGLGALAVALAVGDLLRRWGLEGTWSEVPGRLFRGTLLPLLVGALLLVSCVGWGRIAGRLARWKTLSLSDQFALGILAQAALLLGAGSLGLLHPALGGMFVLVGIASCLFRPSDLRSHLRPIALPSPVQCLWLAPTLLTVLFGTLRALAPEIDGDSLRYHLALPRIYVETGSTSFRPENCFSLMPAYGQMMHVLSLLLSGTTPSRLLGVAAFVVSVRATFQWARRYEPDQLPWMAAGLLGAMVQWRESVGTAMAENFMLMFATLSLYHLSKGLEEPGASGPSLVLAGLFAGGVAGCKLFGILFPVLLAVGIALVARHRWKAALGLGLLGFLLASPWYLRSVLATGNPLWPSFASLFGKDASLVEQNRLLLEYLRTTYTVTSSWLEFPLLPLYATFRGARYDVALDPWALAWIPVALGMRRPTVLNAGLWMALGATVILYAVYVPLIRFFAFFFPVLAVAAAWAMREPQTPRWRLAVTASFLVYALSTAATHLPAVETALLPVLGLESPDRYIAPWIQGYRVSRHATKTLPPDAKVLVVGTTDTFYLERTVVWSDPTIQHDLLLSRYRDIEDLVRRLDQLGIRHVVARGDDPFPSIPGSRKPFLVLHQADGWSLFALK